MTAINCHPCRWTLLLPMSPTVPYGLPTNDSRLPTVRSRLPRSRVRHRKRSVLARRDPDPVGCRLVEIRDVRVVEVAGSRIHRAVELPDGEAVDAVQGGERLR